MPKFLLSLLPLICLASSGCHSKTPPDQPIASAPEMCCQRGSFETHQFGGCIEGPKLRPCPGKYPLWIRGTVSCGPVSEQCLGGRCCEFGQAWGSPDAALEWTPPKDAGFSELEPSIAPSTDAIHSDEDPSDAPSGAGTPDDTAPTVESGPEVKSNPDPC